MRHTRKIDQEDINYIQMCEYEVLALQILISDFLYKEYADLVNESYFDKVLSNYLEFYMRHRHAINFIIAEYDLPPDKEIRFDYVNSTAFWED